MVLIFGTFSLSLFAIFSSIVLPHVNLSGCDSCIQYSRNLFTNHPPTANHQKGKEKTLSTTFFFLNEGTKAPYAPQCHRLWLVQGFTGWDIYACCYHRLSYLQTNQNGKYETLSTTFLPSNEMVVDEMGKVRKQKVVYRKRKVGVTRIKANETNNKSYKDHIKNIARVQNWPDITT